MVIGRYYYPSTQPIWEIDVTPQYVYAICMYS